MKAYDLDKFYEKFKESFFYKTLSATGDDTQNGGKFEESKHGTFIIDLKSELDESFDLESDGTLLSCYLSLAKEKRGNSPDGSETIEKINSGKPVKFV